MNVHMKEHTHASVFPLSVCSRAFVVRGFFCYLFFFVGVSQQLAEMRGVAKKIKDAWPELAFEIFDVLRWDSAYLYTYVFVYIYIYIYKYILHILICRYIHIHIHIHIYTYICIYIYIIYSL